MADYGKVTLRDLIQIVENNPAFFKDGLDTQITTGEVDSVGIHRKHTVMSLKHKPINSDKVSNSLLLEYLNYESRYDRTKESENTERYVFHIEHNGE